MSQRKELLYGGTARGCSSDILSHLYRYNYNNLTQAAIKDAKLGSELSFSSLHGLLQAGQFFLKHAETLEKDLPAKELHELLLLSLQWLSGVITASAP